MNTKSPPSTLGELKLILYVIGGLVALAALLFLAWPYLESDDTYKGYDEYNQHQKRPDTVRVDVHVRE